MANRFWVGGSGSWTSTATTNWSATSGGAGGASAPTSADDVFFDAGSDAGGIFTVTIGTGAVCRDITAGSLDFVMTLAGSADWNIYGSLTFPATNLTRTYTGAVNFLANTTGKTITTNGVTLTTSSLVFATVGGEWTLGSAITIGGINLFAGSFKTAGFNVTCANIVSSYTNVRGLDLGSSTVTFSGAGSPVNFATTTNFTFNAGTSSIVCSATSQTFAGGGLTYYNVSFTSTSAGTTTITGANTFNNLTFTSLAATGMRNISIGANQTVNGTLTLGAANTAIRRMFVRSDTIGTPRTITATTVATLADIDFRDINNAGTGWTGTRLGDCGGNTGITFDAAKTVYRVGAGNWSGTQWALTSGGVANANNFPLAQDVCIFDNNTPTGTITIDTAPWVVNTIDFSAITSAITFTNSPSFVVTGNIVLNNLVTISGAGGIAMAGRTEQTIFSAGVVWTYGFNFLNFGNSVKLLDALVSNGGMTLTSGTLDLNGFDLTATTFSSNNSNVRSIAFGTGEINVTGNPANTPINLPTMTNFSYTGTGLFNVTYSGSDTMFFYFGNTAGVTESNALSLNVASATGIAQLIAGSRIKDINFTGFTGSFANTNPVIYGNVTFASGMTITAGGTTVTLGKTSGTQTLTTNGKTLDFPITKSGAGTLQILDNTTIGSTRTLTHTAGTIYCNDLTLTTGLYSSTGSTARQLDVGTGTLAVTGATFTASGSNYTTAGTGKISMTSASSKTFAGGGFSYPALNQGGAGDLSITGANTFADITNTVQPCQINFPASVNTTVSDLSVNGTAGNLVKLRSSISGTRANIVVV